jgi:hypothetical protein
VAALSAASMLTGHRNLSRRLRWLLALVMAGLLSAGLGALWLDRAENPSAFYPTRAAADSAGAFTRGWLPPSLPPNASNIHETHSLDTNERWASFTAPAGDLRAMVQTARRLSFAEVLTIRPRLPNPLRPHWPPELQPQPLVTPRDAENLGLYRDEAASYCYAVEWPEGRAWGWSCRSPDAAA